jgi:hypothetical protein
MSKDKMKCKCGASDFYTEESDGKVGLYCSECGRLYKWTSKKKHKREHDLNDQNEDNV